MIKRIVDVSEKAYIHIERSEEILGQIPVEDLGVVILQHPVHRVWLQGKCRCRRRDQCAFEQ